ncbi:hypothetical protein EMIHUDRAFT_225816 [Emiliania huxleyi CCMP1516]|uniref:Vacuolar protein 8 n=2 Tax=Emiliania huxleyi TaxID=2903 RepID=A0A0D3KMZ5_EMIH1|nr:hypothetical protein EMIHUDRAFT_225816 [Emiliania huxleyi CCMP1516]EOD37130.1 hypothetical protein EMIHUDRAFT_225816 [Emiliania huxleyi CCMP1516]|eukprot:XP_005789559.1 hypothetical protein EMIHUDRAFT_225816 [Emiliania huxleyi CCMP1516]
MSGICALLSRCLPSAEEEELWYEGLDSENGRGGPSDVELRVHALGVACDQLDRRTVVAAAAALRDLACAPQNQAAIDAHGGWAAADRAGALLDDHADSMRRDEIAAVGGAHALAAALSVFAPPEAREAAAQAARYLSFGPAGQHALLSAEAMPRLVALLRAPRGGGGPLGSREPLPASEEAREAAAAAVANLAGSPEGRAAAARAGAVGPLVALCRAADPAAPCGPGGAGLPPPGRNSGSSAGWGPGPGLLSPSVAVAAAGGAQALLALLAAEGRCGARSSATATHAARGLANLSVHLDIAAAIVAGGGVPLLVGLVGSRRAEEAEAASAVLANLSLHESGRRALLRAGGAPSEPAREAAANALHAFAADATGRAAIFAAGGVTGLVAGLHGSGGAASLPRRSSAPSLHTTAKGGGYGSGYGEGKLRSWLQLGPEALGPESEHSEQAAVEAALLALSRMEADFVPISGLPSWRSGN